MLGVRVRGTRRALDGYRVELIDDQVDPGRPLGEYLPDEFAPDTTIAIVAQPSTGRGGTYVATDAEWNELRLAAGDEVGFVEMPGVAGTLAFLSWVAVEVLIPAAIGTALSFGIQALIGTPDADVVPDLPEPTNTWGGVQTTAQSGIPKPIVFGRHTVGGNVLQLSTHGTYVNQAGGASVFDENLYLIVGLCKGPVGEVGDLYINENPVANYNALVEVARNGSNVEGAIDQDPISPPVTLSDATTNQALNVDLISNSVNDGEGETRSFTTDSAVDRVDLNVFFTNGLTRLGTNGYVSAQIEYRVRYRVNDPVGIWSAWENVFLDENRPSPFVSTSQHAMPGLNIYDFEVERYTARTTNTNISDAMQLTSAVLRRDELFSRPGLVHVGVRLIANDSLRGRVPDIKAFIEAGWIHEKWDGVDPDSPTYVDAGPDYANPGWLVVAMLRDEDLDLANELGFVEIDLPAFETWADWCDELVDDGQGGQEVRARFDGVFSGTETPMSAILRICAVGRANLVVTGARVSVKFDAPRSRRQLFTMGSIRRDSFQVTYLPRRGRATWFGTRYLNQDIDYEIDVIGVDDPDAVADGLPLVKKVNELIGVTRKSHALREATFALNIERYADRLVRFEAAWNAIDCEPGDRIGVQHDVPQWGHGGLIVSATATTLVVDRDLIVEAGRVYEIAVQDRETQTEQTVELDLAQHPPGTYVAGSTIYLDGTLSPVPETEAPYSFGVQNLAVLDLSVLNIRARPDGDVEVLGIRYDERMFDTEIAPFGDLVYSSLPNPLAVLDCLDDPPDLVERLEPPSSGPGWMSVVDVSWSIPVDSPAVASRIYFRDAAATAPVGFTVPWTFIAEVPSPASVYTIRAAAFETGETYEIRVVLVSSGGAHRDPEDCTGTTVEIQNVGLLPSRPQNLTIARSGLVIVLSWDPVSNADYYEVRRGGAEWQQSRLVGTLPGTNLVTDQWCPTVGTGNPREIYWVRAVNGGLYGPPAYLETPSDLGAWRDSATGVLQQSDLRDLGWPGTKTNIATNADGHLTLIDPALPGSYETTELDLANLKPWRIGTILRAGPDDGPLLQNILQPYRPTSYGILNDWHGPIDPASWYMSTIFSIRVASTPGGTAAATYVPEMVQDWTSCRYVQLRIQLATTDSDWTPEVRELYLTAEEVI